MSELQALPNIGAKLDQQLRAVGISSVEELRRTGAKEAWLRILSLDPSACLLRLSALEGAVRNLPKNQLDAETKEDLRAFFHAHKPQKSAGHSKAKGKAQERSPLP